MNFDNNTLRRIWNIEMDILDVIDKVCRENNLKYSLAYGSMLGAVRHGGFIPWDDDMDIWMLRVDYDKFVKIWEASDIKGYCLLSQDKKREFTQSFIKIRKDNTAFVSKGEEDTNFHHGIFVDIFPMDNVCNSPVGAKFQKMYAMLYMLYSRGYASEHDGKLMYWGCRFMLSIVPKNSYMAVSKFFYNKLLKYNIPSYTAEKVINFATFPDIKFAFEKHWLQEWETVDFDGHKYMCNKNRNAILKFYFGDYMQLPPVEDRVWKHNPVIIDFEKEYWPK